jgi:predicted nucleotidyltransferase
MFAQVQINEMALAIARAVNPLSVILFGSYARGDMRKESDLDLLVVERDNFNKQRSRWKEILAIRNAIRSFRGAKDILVYSSEEINLLRCSPNHIVGDAFREGKVIYEA